MPQLLARLGSDDPYFYTVYMPGGSGPVAVFLFQQHAEEWMEQKEVSGIAEIIPCELVVNSQEPQPGKTHYRPTDHPSGRGGKKVYTPSATNALGDGLPAGQLSHQFAEENQGQHSE